MKVEAQTLHYPVCMADTDANGVVYHARFIEMAERARNKLMNHLGFTFATLAQRYEALLVIRRVEGVYHAPALLDDELVLRTRLKKCLPSRSEWITDIWRAEMLLASVTIEIVTLHKQTRQLMPHPPELLQKLALCLEAAAHGAAATSADAATGTRPSAALADIQQQTH
jgi:acyl-CoA thioester hydrolase